MNEARRQLIFLWNYLGWGGAQIYFIGIMKLAKQTWDVIVILPKGSDPKLLGFLDQIGVTYKFLEYHVDMNEAPTLRRKIERRISLIRSDLEVFRFLSRFDLKQCILHIEAAPWQAGTLLTCLSLRGANIFVTLHNALPQASRLRESLWGMRIGFVSKLRGLHIFTSNQDTKDRFRRWVRDRFWQTIRVTYTTVNPPEIDAAREAVIDRPELRRKYGISPDSFVVLALGQFIDRKGRWDLLEAARQVLSVEHDVQFVWLTSSPISDDDLTRIRQFELGDRFILLPSSSIGDQRSDVLSFYRTADIYALPSYVEGLPVALLEAMAIGLPSVSTNIYAIPEAIKHQETGLLIEPGKPGELAKSILWLRHDEELRERLSVAGRTWVIDHFDERVASRIALDAYEECFPNG